VIVHLLLLRALQSMMNLGLFYDCSPYVRLQSLKVSQQLKLFTGWGRQPYAQPPPQPEQPGYPFLSGSSPLTCPAWEIYQQLRYRQHSSQDNMTTQAPPLRQSRETYGGDCPSGYILNAVDQNHTICLPCALILLETRYRARQICLCS
jgi:hypothetical protein